MAKKDQQEEEMEMMDESMMEILDDDVMDEPDPEPLPKGTEALLCIKTITAKLNKDQNKKLLNLMCTVLRHDRDDVEAEPPPVFVTAIISKVEGGFLRRMQRDFLRAFDITPSDIAGWVEGHDFDEWAEGFELEECPLKDLEKWAVLGWKEYEGVPSNTIERWL